MNLHNSGRPPASADEIRLERLRKRRRSYPAWRLVRANARDIFLLARQAWTALFLLALLLGSSALYLQWLAGSDDFVEALYATMLLLVFEGGVAFPDDPLGRLIFFAVPLFGLVFLLQSLVDFTRLVFNKDARREGWQISLASTFSDHTVVCGIGRVGYRVVLQLLDAGYELVAVDIDPASEFAETVRRLKVPLVVGDARDPDVLRSAGLRRASGLIAAIDDDMKNIEIALTARRSRQTLPTVMRIFHRALDVSLERRFGRNSAFSSSALAAPTFAAASVSRQIVHALRFPDALLGVSELAVAEESLGSGVVGAFEERYQVRVIRVRAADGRERSRSIFAKLNAGDVVLLLGSLDALERVRIDHAARAKHGVLEHLPVQRPTPQFDTVIICGLGKVGSAVLQLLLGITPCPRLVVICTPQTPPETTEALEARGVQVVRGDAREPAMLKLAGIERAYAVAALFGDDLINLQIGLAARELRPDLHLVLRVFSDVLAERLGALFGINTAYSTSALAAPTLAAAAVLPRVDYAFDVGERLFALETLRPGLALTVSELREQADVLVVAVQRNGVRDILPAHTLPLEPDDELILLGDLRTLSRLRSNTQR